MILVIFAAVILLLSVAGAFSQNGDVGATGDSQNAYNAGSTIGTYLNTLGFNMDFAPVADVLTNPQDINRRRNACSSGRASD